MIFEVDMKEILTRLGYVRNQANLSARQLSLQLGKSPQYIAQIENGRIALTIERLLQILEICNFSVERFFSPNIQSHYEDKELVNLIMELSQDKKKNIIEFIRK